MGTNDRHAPEPADAEQRELLERLERVELEIESLGNRMNTLVRLLDILNKRVDQLESGHRPTSP